MALASLDFSKLKSQLIFLSPDHDNQIKPILLVLPITTGSNGSKYIVGELNPSFVWGNKEDYPSDVNLCVYMDKVEENFKLFCSTDRSISLDNSLNNPENKGEWELFLTAEFQSIPLKFVTQRQELLKVSPESFVNNSNFVRIALVSFLLVALFGLIQIRRTMIPLERLLVATRNLAAGNFSPVEIHGKSEFSELATSFNGMSLNIKKQIEKLQIYSKMDLEIATKLEVVNLVNFCLDRIQKVFPSTYPILLKLHTTTETHHLFDALAPGNVNLIHNKLLISLQEVESYKTFNKGRFSKVSSDTPLIAEQLIYSFNLKHGFILPLLWQGNLTALLCIGSEIEWNKFNEDLTEIYELARRISLAIAAQDREDKLIFQSQYDELTKLPNRALMQDRINRAIENSQRNSLSFWVIFLDLDHFKFINDSLGHRIGDLLLIEISRRLAEVVRGDDTTARFGGDEFILVLQEQHNLPLNTNVLTRIIESIKQPFVIEENEVSVTCSMGIASYPIDGNSMEVLLSNADLSMYHAKELGKNNYQFFNALMHKKASDRLQLEQQLRKALKLNEFKLHYQPKVDVNNGLIVGMEALIRWQNKELGFVSPYNFIPLAEETGLIIPIGEWVLRTACAQAVEWERAGFKNLLMSVNLSGRQFKQSNLIELIEQILSGTGLDGSKLELELTESLIMDDLDSSIITMQNIRNLNVQLSIDDFGTGYSSLAYLQKFPLNTLKIDKSFIDGIQHQDDQSPIVDSIIDLAKNLGLKVVAEGVETIEQLNYLKQHECDEIQGYYFYRPSDPVAIGEALKLNFA